MKDLRIRLTKQSVKALSEAASALNMTPEQTFEYLVRNTLPAYANLAEEGHIRYFHSNELTARLKLKDKWFIDKVIFKLFSKGKPARTLGSDVLTAAIDTKTKAEVEATARRFDIVATDLYNRLVQVGSDLAIHLKTGTAYAFSKKNESLGMIEFRP